MRAGLGPLPCPATPLPPDHPPPAAPHLVLCRLHGRPVLGQHHGQGEEKHEQPVAHVTEHDGEEEGEGDDGVGRCGQRGHVVSQDPHPCTGCHRGPPSQAPGPQET